MNHPLVAAASGVFFGCFLGAGAFLTQLHPDLPAPPVQEAVLVSAPVPIPVEVAPAVSIEVSEGLVESSEIDDCENSHTTLTAARLAYARGDYDEAIRLAEFCTDVTPLRANRIIGASSCVLHDLECLRTAYRGLDEPGREYLVRTCEVHGVTFHKRGKHLIAKAHDD